MKVITEEKLRKELGRDCPAFYCIPEGTLLTPAAREYLQQKSIRIIPKDQRKEEKSSRKARVPKGGTTLPRAMTSSQSSSTTIPSESAGCHWPERPPSRASRPRGR